MREIKEILKRESWEKDNIKRLLSASKEEADCIFQESARVKKEYVGNLVYFRGLVEFSNICRKNCLYCGIRSGNHKVNRYNLEDEEILFAAEYASKNNYGSLVLQSGEIESPAFTRRIENLLKRIKAIGKDKLGITLSLGEQTIETYRRWFDAGAHRYLLRVEATNQALYKKIHPVDSIHRFERRLECLKNLQKTGYQTGTGVMIGLPFQSIDDLAHDLLFMKEIDIDMVGMGPYIEHPDTPLNAFADQLAPLEERFFLSLKMIAVLRLMMKDINIAAATALQAIDAVGREKAIKVGANVIMPNITPGQFRDSYRLYNNKPCTDESYDDCNNCLEVRIGMVNHEIGYNHWGDSPHYFKRVNKAD